MNSWLTLFLPKDEYKQKRLFHFLAEAAALSILYSIAMIGLSLRWSLDTSLTLLGGLGLMLLYVLARYVLSGMEYTEVFTKKEYHQQLKKIVGQTLGFVVIYFLVYSVMTSFPSTRTEWVEFGGFLGLLAFFYFGIHYLSLRRSFTKNRHALD